MEILHKEYIIIGIILLLIIIFIPISKIKIKNKKSKIVANTRFIKNTKFYKNLDKKYKILTILTLVSFIIISLTSILLIARIQEASVEETEKSSRDIILLMDISPSMYNIDYDVTKGFVNLINTLDGDRVSLIIFDQSTFTLVPLTDDYIYIRNEIEKLQSAFEEFLSTGNTSKIETYHRYVEYGEGYSLVGNAMMTTLLAMTREDNQNKDRTRMIILSTDNQAAPGVGIFTQDNSSEYAKENNIKIYGIVHEQYKNQTDAKKLIKSLEKCDGKVFFGYGPAQINNIVDEINKTNQTISIEKETLTYKIDKPEVLVIILLISFMAYSILIRKSSTN